MGVLPERGLPGEAQQGQIHLLGLHLERGEPPGSCTELRSLPLDVNGQRPASSSRPRVCLCIDPAGADAVMSSLGCRERPFLFIARMCWWHLACFSLPCPCLKLKHLILEASAPCYFKTGHSAALSNFFPGVTGLNYPMNPAPFPCNVDATVQSPWCLLGKDTSAGRACLMSTSGSAT